jgi:hypothetical protein
MDNNRNRSVWWWIIGGAAVLLLLIIILPSLSNDANNTVPGLPNTGSNTDNTSGNSQVTVGDIVENPAAYTGARVQVQGEVENYSKEGRRVFALDELGVANDRVLVVTRQQLDPDIDEGSKVSVTGTVREFAAAEVERELGIDIAPQIETEFQNRQVVIADSVSIVDR